MTSPVMMETEARPQTAAPQALFPKKLFVGILLLAVILRTWNLTINGFANPYYSAAVRSMSMSWHNFFYLAFDPVGFVSLDKPPLAIWAQVIGTKLFGFTPFGILFPQAGMGVAAVALAFDAVRRTLGAWAGLIAALALTVMPIAVVLDRHNNPDSMMQFLLIASAWALVRAIPRADFRWLAASMVLAGLAVNTKMLQALVPMPAFFLAYLLTAGTTWKNRAIQLGLGALILAVVSASWVTVFDLTPPAARPYAGSSTDGTMRDLFIGYNGLSRVNGSVGAGPGAPPPLSEMGGFPGVGKPGLLRFSDRTFSAQSFWLFPFALIGGVAALLRKRGVAAVILFGGWAVLSWAVLSVSKGIVHTYYAVMLAAPVAAVFGVAAVTLWELSREAGWRRWLLPAAILATAAWQQYLDGPVQLWQPRAVMWALTVLSLAMFAFGRYPRFGGAATPTGLAVLGFLCCPTVWSVASLAEAQSEGLPQANPPAIHGGARDPQAFIPADPDLLRYLSSHRGNERILAAGANAPLVGPLVVASGLPIVAMGGFLGMDRAMPAATLARLVQEHSLRFVLSTQMDMMSGDRARSEWVRDNCSIVPEAKWRGSLATKPSSLVVFDCKDN